MRPPTEESSPWLAFWGAPKPSWPRQKPLAHAREPRIPTGHERDTGNLSVDIIGAPEGTRTPVFAVQRATDLGSQETPGRHICAVASFGSSNTGGRGRRALTLLVTYARAVADALPLATADLQRLAVTHMHDLLAATIGATRDGRAIAEDVASPPRGCEPS